MDNNFGEKQNNFPADENGEEIKENKASDNEASAESAEAPAEAKIMESLPITESLPILETKTENETDVTVSGPFAADTAAPIDTAVNEQTAYAAPQAPIYGVTYAQPQQSASGQQNYSQPSQQNQQYGGWQGYTQYNPYPPKAPKNKLPLGLRVFLFVISILAAGTLIGFAGFGIYKSVNSTSAENNSIYSIPLPEESESPEESDTPDSPYENSGSGENSEIVQPDIDVDPYTAGIAISSKPTGAELSAEEIYAKVEPSTVAVTAVISTSSGTQEGVGTGIFLTENGYILTNSHVVGNTKSSGLTVTTSDGTEYPAVTVGYDKTTDIAVIKIDGSGFTPAEFGNEDELGIGEWVIAIGNPGGTEFSGSLTRGVISGLDRKVGSYSSNGMTYIQTDAAINPGNSGGPLVNMYGQVVGMNSSKIVADYYEGMGFAIPISGAKNIIDQLLSEGYVSGRVRLGIVAQNTQFSAYSQVSGVTIVTINDESSFTGTDAQEGDIITAVDGKEVTNLTTLSNVLLDYNPGDQATVTLNRDGTEIEVTVTFLEDKGETQ